MHVVHMQGRKDLLGRGPMKVTADEVLTTARDSAMHRMQEFVRDQANSAAYALRTVRSYRALFDTSMLQVDDEILKDPGEISRLLRMSHVCLMHGCPEAMTMRLVHQRHQIQHLLALQHTSLNAATIHQNTWQTARTPKHMASRPTTHQL